MRPRRAAAVRALGVASVLLLPLASAAIATVSLGTADSFAILAGAGITNTGSTIVVGDVGSHPTVSQTGFGPGADSVTLTGTNHFGDSVTQAAKVALVTAYNDAAGRPGGTPVGDLAGLTLVPGVYVDDNVPDSMTLTGVLTLDGLNDTSSVFIFQSDSTLTLASNSVVRLINGAQACNIFWQVGSSATLGTGSHLEGNILALTSITLDTGATVTGSVLARNGAVTMDTNTIRDSACLPICDGPTIVTAIAQDDASILVTWSPVASATSYNVYRAVGAGTFTLLTSTSNLTITDTDVDSGVTYRYEVSAIVDGQETERCTTAEATAIPDFPTVLAAGAAAILGVGLYALLRRRP